MLPICQEAHKALRKVSTRTLDDETLAHSFATFLAELSTIVRNTCRSPNNDDATSTFNILTTQNAKQRYAFELLQSIDV